jgi:hypothetical protein
VVEVDRCETAVDSIGVVVGAGVRITARGSVIHGAGVGMHVAAGGRAVLTSVEFLGNGTGLLIRTGGDARGTRVRFVDNGWGIQAEPEAVVVFGGSLATGGEFLDNRHGAVRALGDSLVRVPFYYWGTVDCDSIRAMVEGPVAFTPFTGPEHAVTFTDDDCP